MGRTPLVLYVRLTRHFFFARQLRVRRAALLASALLSLYSTSSSRVNAALHLCHTAGKVLFYFRFPEAQHHPAVIAQFDGVFEVTLHITPDFFVPIFYVGRNVVAL